jgi:hypothetical protein
MYAADRAIAQLGALPVASVVTIASAKEPTNVSRAAEVGVDEVVRLLPLRGELLRQRYDGNEAEHARVELLPVREGVDHGAQERIRVIRGWGRHGRRDSGASEDAQKQQDHGCEELHD